MGAISKGRGYVYSIQYHVVWCVKYRHTVSENTEKQIREYIRNQKVG